MKTFCEPEDRREIVGRLGSLRHDSPRRWGRMNAPHMVAHPMDQMSICLGGKQAAPMPGVDRWPGIRYLILHVLRWPRGRVEGSSQEVDS